MRRSFPVHPILFTAFPILALYANNFDSVTAREAAGPLLIALVGTSAVFGFSLLLLRDAAKAGLTATATALVFFSHGYVHDGLINAAPFENADQIIRHRWLLLLDAALVGGVAWFALRTRRDLANTTRVLNFTGVVLICLVTVNLAQGAIAEHQAAAVAPLAPAGPGNGTFHTNATSPDIYLILVDERVRSDTLRDRFGYDDTSFRENLSSLGLHVVPRSRTNYPSTTMVLASMLNMRYVNDISSLHPPESADQFVPTRLVDQNHAIDVLRSHGYEYVHFDSGWGPTKQDARADRMISCGRWSAFDEALLRTTAAFPLTVVASDREAAQRDRIECQFRALSEIPKSRAPGDPPRFVFDHFIAPHAPYVFSPEDGPREAEPTFRVGEDPFASDRGRYVDQVRATDRFVEASVKSILENSTTPPVIVLFSDEGMMYRWSWSGDDESIRDRMRNFEAVYLPGSTAAVADDVGPVNLMRLVLNEYAGGGFPPIEERSYFQPLGSARFYDLVDVTDVVEPRVDP